MDLHDAELRRHHTTGPDGCFLEKEDEFDPPVRVCHLQVPISDRWTLHVYGRPSLHPDAEALAKWAARRLEAHLPKSAARDESYPPFGGGGGGSVGLRRDRHPDLVGAQDPQLVLVGPGPRIGALSQLCLELFL